MFAPVGNHLEISDWFPVRIESAEGDGYLFVEWENDPTGTGQDKEGGRNNTADDLAYPIDGSTFAADDIALARRAPGMGGVGWELVRPSGADASCCPSTLPYSYPLVCPEEGSGSSTGSGDLGFYYADGCGCGGLWPFTPDQLAAIGGYTGIDTILVGACGSIDGTWADTLDSLGYPLIGMPTGFYGCAGLGGGTPAGVGGGGPGVALPRVMCASIRDGTGSFAGLTPIEGIEVAYNFSGNNSGWTINYYDPDAGFRISGVMRACPDREPGFYFVGYVYSENPSESGSGGDGAGSGSGSEPYPCGCMTRFPACPPESDSPPSQEVTNFGPFAPRMDTLVNTACGSFTIRLADCPVDYTFCCELPTGYTIGVTIPDGPNAGTYKPAGAPGELLYYLANGDPVTLQCSDGVYTLANKSETVTSVTVACDPFAVVMGAGFGSTGAITLEAVA